MSQLVLPFLRDAAFRAEDFIADRSNRAALRWLAEPARWPSGRLLLTGPTGTGKSHLLHVAAQRHGWAVLHGPDLAGLPPPPRAGVALDEADMPGEEASLFHLLNAAAEARVPVLMAAPRPPARWPVRLPDLRSRLAASGVTAVEEPSDALLEALFLKHLSDRQLLLDAGLREAILLRLPRSAGMVAEAAARLDRASLAAGRLSRPVAMAAIAPLLGDDASVTREDDPLPAAPALL